MHANLITVAAAGTDDATLLVSETMVAVNASSTGGGKRASDQAAP